MNILQFFVAGIPAPAGSKTAFYIKKLGRSVITDACKRTKPWQANVSACAMEAAKGMRPMEGPLRLSCTFYMTRPKGHFGKKGLKLSAPCYPTVKPDTTKLIRAVEDAMTGIVWRDDAQVVHQHATKRYADGSCQTPGVMIEVEEI